MDSWENVLAFGLSLETLLSDCQGNCHFYHPKAQLLKCKMIIHFVVSKGLKKRLK